MVSLTTLLPLVAQGSSGVPHGFPRVWIGVGLWGLSLLSAGFAWAANELARRETWGSGNYEIQSLLAPLASVGFFVGGCVLTIGGLIDVGVPVPLAALAPLVPVGLVFGGWRLELARQRLVAREQAAQDEGRKGDGAR